jgi:hypothetical protein
MWLENFIYLIYLEKCCGQQINHSSDYIVSKIDSKLNVFLAGSHNKNSPKTLSKGSSEVNNSTLRFCKTPLAGDRGWKENLATKGQVGRERRQKSSENRVLNVRKGVPVCPLEPGRKDRTNKGCEQRH